MFVNTLYKRREIQNQLEFKFTKNPSFSFHTVVLKTAFGFWRENSSRRKNVDIITLCICTDICEDGFFLSITNQTVQKMVHIESKADKILLDYLRITNRFLSIF